MFFSSSGQGKYHPWIEFSLPISSSRGTSVPGWAGQTNGWDERSWFPNEKSSPEAGCNLKWGIFKSDEIFDIQPLFDGICMDLLFALGWMMMEIKGSCLFRCMFFFWRILVLDGFIFRQVLLFRLIFFVRDFWFRLIFLRTFQMDMFVGILFHNFMMLLLEQHGFFRAFGFNGHSDHQEHFLQIIGMSYDQPLIILADLKKRCYALCF